jgi:hypothetical protein
MLAALVWRLLAARAAVNRYPDDADIYEEDVLPVRRIQKDPALLSQVTCCYSIVLIAIATYHCSIDSVSVLLVLLLALLLLQLHCPGAAQRTARTECLLVLLLYRATVTDQSASCIATLLSSTCFGVTCLGATDCTCHVSAQHLSRPQ